MELTVIDSETVAALAPVEALMDWMRDAMKLTSKRDAVLPLRRGLELPDDFGAIGMMPGYLGGDFESAGVKLVSLAPPHRRKGSSHLGLMVLYDADGLLPVALLCGATVTAIRTSAMTAVATDALARKDAASLAILGAGEQAFAHARALSRIRPFNKYTVWNIDAALTERFIAAAADELGLHFEVASDVASAVADADVVCTVTSAPTPILFGDMVKPGAHVNLVGSSHRGAAEADNTLVALARFFVDFKPSTFDQAGEFNNALEAGVVTEAHIRAEIGEVLSGDAPGRQSADEVTLYKSLGVAAQDIATARMVYRAAKARGLGAKVRL